MVRLWDPVWLKSWRLIYMNSDISQVVFISVVIPVLIEERWCPWDIMPHLARKYKRQGRFAGLDSCTLANRWCIINVKNNTADDNHATNNKKYTGMEVPLIKINMIGSRGSDSNLKFVSKVEDADEMPRACPSRLHKHFPFFGFPYWLVFSIRKLYIFNSEARRAECNISPRNLTPCAWLMGIKAFLLTSVSIPSRSNVGGISKLQVHKAEHELIQNIEVAEVKYPPACAIPENVLRS